MTTTYDDPKALLALARLARFPLSRVGYPLLPLVRDFLDMAIEDGLVVLDEASRKYVTTTAAPSADDLYGLGTPLPFVNADADDHDAKFVAQAWRVLLLAGSAVDLPAKKSGFSTAPAAQADSVLHVLLCGLDVAASTKPDIEEWSNFTGTFSPNDEINGLTAVPVCACGRVRKYMVMNYVIDGDEGLGKLMRLLTAN
jgi:hypothetical protein